MKKMRRIHTILLASALGAALIPVVRKIRRNRSERNANGRSASRANARRTTRDAAHSA